MPKEFNDEAYADMEAVGGKQWCQDNLQAFVAHLLATLKPEEMTQAAIRDLAKSYIFALVDDTSFAEVRTNIEQENPAMVGIYIRVMAEYMLELVISRG